MKPIILFILLIKSFSICAQEDINNEKKTSRTDYELLQEAEQYLTAENNSNKKAFNIGHQVLKRTTDRNDRIYAHNILAFYHYYRYTIDSSFFYAHNGLKLIGKKQDSLSLQSLSEFYKILANASRDKNLIEDSKKWSLKGIETSRKSGNLTALDEHTINLAISYRIMGDPAKALALLEKVFERKEYPERYGSIALCYLDLGKFEDALIYHKKFLEYSERIDSKRSIAITLMNIGAVYSDMYKDDEALIYFNKSLLLAKKHKYALIELNNILNINIIFEDRKEFKKAKKGYQDVLKVAKKEGYLKQQLFVYQKLKNIATANNQYKEALGYVEKKSHLRDSMNKMQKDEEIAKLEIKYETIKKEKEIAVLKQNQELKLLEIEKEQSEKRKLIYVFVIISLFLIGLLILYAQKLRNQHVLNKNQKEIGEQKIKELIINQELKLIKSSVKVQDKERKRIAQELHDRIGGNLAAIKLQVSSVEESPSTISRQLDDTYDQLRALSHELIPKRVRHTNFIQLLKEYMGNIGNASKLNIHISAYPETEINQIDEFLHNELFSVFQELITNTMKHANARMVTLQMYIRDDIISVIFEDNGIGFSPNVMLPGIGLTNIKNRIDLLSGTMNIDTYLERGTIINIEIPKHQSRTSDKEY